MSLQLQVEKRELLRKKAKQLSDEGRLLGNIHGKGEASIAIHGAYKEMSNVVETAGYNHPIELTVAGEKVRLVLVSDVDRDTISQRLHHVTFQTIKRGVKVTTTVPVTLIGESPAVRQGLVLVTLIDEIEIEAIPSQIPEVLEADISSLEEEGDSVAVASLTIPDGVSISIDESLLIAKIDRPRAQVEEDEEAEEELGTGAADVPSEFGSDEAAQSEGKEVSGKSE